MKNKKALSLNRRQFLQALAASPLAWASESGEPDPEGLQRRRIPMLQTWADDTSAWVVILGKGGWSFKAPAPVKVTLLQTQNLAGTADVLYRLQVEGLSSSIYSPIQILNAQGKVLESRRLKGLDLQASLPKVAVVSCANYRKLKTQRTLYSHVQEQSPDLMLFIGDIVYSNSQWSSVFSTPEDPSTALERYITTWKSVNLYQLDPLIPALAIWDDHDYGANGGDHTHPYKAEMKTIFRSFYAMPSSHQNLSYGPGVAFRFTAFGIDFHMLDGRTERISEETLWGRHQEEWLAEEFNKRSNPAWILNGVQYFRYFVAIESVEKGAAPSLEMLKDLLRRRKKPAVLVSGDVHCSQVQELPPSVFGFKTYEITSSGIHCNSAGPLLRRGAEEGQIFYYGKDNFLILQPRIQSSGMDLEIRCASEEGLFDGPRVEIRN